MGCVIVTTKKGEGRKSIYFPILALHLSVTVAALPTKFVLFRLEFRCNIVMHVANLSSWFQQGMTVGLYFTNRPEWIVVDHACSAYSFISVPLYDTLGIDLYASINYVFLTFCMLLRF